MAIADASVDPQIRKKQKGDDMAIDETTQECLAAQAIYYEHLRLLLRLFAGVQADWGKSEK